MEEKPPVPVIASAAGDGNGAKARRRRAPRTTLLHGGRGSRETAAVAERDATENEPKQKKESKSKADGRAGGGKTAWVKKSERGEGNTEGELTQKKDAPSPAARGSGEEERKTRKPRSQRATGGEIQAQKQRKEAKGTGEGGEEAAQESKRSQMGKLQAKAMKPRKEKKPKVVAEKTEDESVEANTEKEPRQRPKHKLRADHVGVDATADIVEKATKKTERKERPVKPPKKPNEDMERVSKKGAAVNDKKKAAATTRVVERQHQDVLKDMLTLVRSGVLTHGGGSPLTVLMVAEKPSIADSIAKALVTSDYNVYGGKTPVHEFPGYFEGHPCVYKVTSVTGHMFSCDFPPEYASWDSVEPATLFMAPTLKKMESPGVFRQLQSEGKGADILVLWLDCDREGENICFEVIETVQSKMRKHFHGEPIVLRAKFSAINKSDIHKALETLILPNENEALSVDARQEMDLKVGVAFSRFQTRYFQGRYGDLDSSLVSYGPCQTPTLGFCVDRYDEIESFIPKAFWTLDAEIAKSGHNVKLEWDRGRLFEQETVVSCHNTVKDDGMVRVTNVKKSETTRPRPTPLNTVNMLQHASKVLGMGPYSTMQTAERLYLQGYISYPRTESTSYPDSYDIRGSLAQHAMNPYWGYHVQDLLRSGYQKPKKGVDVGDHPPITPQRSANPSDLPGDMGRLYDFIARYFIATVSPDAKLLATKVQFSCAGETFGVSGTQVISKGFTEVMVSATLGDTLLPDFHEDELLPMASIQVRKGFTTPPGYLTESELIGLMEKHGIGTDASIPAHINNICERNYVRLGTGRTLVPTSLGVVLVHGYHKVDPELVLPRVRASIEEQCSLIAKGVKTKSDVSGTSTWSIETLLVVVDVVAGAVEVVVDVRKEA